MEECLQIFREKLTILLQHLGESNFELCPHVLIYTGYKILRLSIVSNPSVLQAVLNFIAPTCRLKLIEEWQRLYQNTPSLADKVGGRCVNTFPIWMTTIFKYRSVME